MNDRDFDKLFGDRLREERRFNEDDSEWTRLSERLDAVSRGNSAAIIGESNPFRRWILPLALLLLLATSGLLWGKLMRSNNVNAMLNEQVNALKMPLKTSQDTLFITRVDTVFIEHNTGLTLKKNNANNLNNANSSQLIGSNSDSNSNYNYNSNYNSNLIYNSQLNSNPQLQTYNLQLQSKIIELENKLQVSENQQLELKNELKKIEEKVNQLALNTPLNTTELLAKMVIKNDSLNAIIALIQSDSVKKLTQKITDSTSINPALKKLDTLSLASKLANNATKNIVKTNKKPMTARLFVGVSGGPIFYKSTWKSPQNLDVYRNEKSYQAGLKLEYALTDHLRLTASGDYCPFNFQIFWQDSRYNLPIPKHVYTTTEKVKSSSANQELVQAAIGAKYMFTNGTNRWRPYVGVGYTAMKILPFQTVFDIQNLATSAIRMQTETSSGTTIANVLLLNGGLEYRFNRRFVAQGEAFYNLELNRPQKTYDLFGVRGALLLNF